MYLKLLLISSLVFLFITCTTDDATNINGSQNDDSPADSAQNNSSQPMTKNSTVLPLDYDFSTPPESTIGFSDSSYRYLTNPLFSGAQVTISTDLDVFTNCGPDGDIIATVITDNGEEFEVAINKQGYRERSGSFTIPQNTKELQIYFNAKGTNGCEDLVDNDGNNYSYIVYQWNPTTIYFRSDWSETASGDLTPGGVVVIDYDIARLPECRGWHDGYEAWDIEAQACFNDGEIMIQSLIMTESLGDNRYERNKAYGIYPIPYNATNFEIWFENSDYSTSSCQKWDSNYEQNYKFDI